MALAFLISVAAGQFDEPGLRLACAQSFNDPSMMGAPTNGYFPGGYGGYPGLPGGNSFPGGSSGYPGSFPVIPSAPTEIVAPARPSNWTGRARATGANRPGGTSLEDDAEPFDPREARRLTRAYRDRDARARTRGGPVSPPQNVLDPAVLAVLGSAYPIEGDPPAPLAPSAPPTHRVAGPTGERVINPPALSVAPPGTLPPLGTIPAAGPRTYAGPPSNLPTAAPPQVAMAAPPAPPATGPARGAAANVPPAASPTNESQKLAAEATQPLESSAPEAESAPADEIEATTVLARIDQEVILASDILTAVDEILASHAAQIPKSDWAATRQMLVQKRLVSLLETKILYVDAKRTIPKEGLVKIAESLGEEFDKQELKKRLRQAKLDNRVQLDAELRRMGSSLDHEKKAWIEHQLAQQWLHRQVKLDEEITREQMLEAYRKNLADYEHKARAGWEEIKVNVTANRPRLAAWKRLAEAGNRLWAGAPFAEVAKAYSDGSTAREGGQRQLVSKGSLVSAVLDHALFNLPIGQLSPILEDKQALYIIRVLEREEEGVVPFTEAQAQIKEKIRAERVRKQMYDYMDKLKQKYRIWTVFDANAAATEVTAAKAPQTVPR